MRALVVLAAIAVTAAGCISATPPPAPGGDTSGGTSGGSNATGPAWSFRDTEGGTHSRDAPEGNATVLFFMASWCSSCRSKTPLLAKLHTEYAPKAARFYSVSFDPTDNDASLRAWKEKYSQAWPHGVDPGFQIQRTFGVTSQSSLVVLDGKGEVVSKWGYGGASENALREALDKALST